MELRCIGLISCLIIVVTALPPQQTTDNKSEITKENQIETTIDNKLDINHELEVRTTPLDEQTVDIPQMEISEIQLNDQQQENILELNAAISQQSNVDTTAAAERKGRELKETKPNVGLSQAEIRNMISMISFPQANAKISSVKPTAILEPRNEGNTRNSRAYDHSYLVFAVADVDEKNPLTAPKFKKLHIIPAESSVMGSTANLGRSADQEDEEDGRFFKMHTLNKYVRRLMRMIRKGTWKVTKSTFFRAADPQTKTPVMPSFAGLYLKQASELQPINL